MKVKAKAAAKKPAAKKSPASKTTVKKGGDPLAHLRKISAASASTRGSTASGGAPASSNAPATVAKPKAPAPAPVAAVPKAAAPVVAAPAPAPAPVTAAAPAPVVAAAPAPVVAAPTTAPAPVVPAPAPVAPAAAPVTAPAPVAAPTQPAAAPTPAGASPAPNAAAPAAAPVQPTPPAQPAPKPKKKHWFKGALIVMGVLTLVGLCLFGWKYRNDRKIVSDLKAAMEDRVTLPATGKSPEEEARALFAPKAPVAETNKVPAPVATPQSSTPAMQQAPATGINNHSGGIIQNVHQNFCCHGSVTPNAGTVGENKVQAKSWADTHTPDRSGLMYEGCLPDRYGSFIVSSNALPARMDINFIVPKGATAIPTIYAAWTEYEWWVNIGTEESPKWIDTKDPLWEGFEKRENRGNSFRFHSLSDHPISITFKIERAP